MNSTKIDVNYFSITDSSYAYFCGGPSPVEVKSIPYPLELMPADYEKYSDILKISGRNGNLLLVGAKIYQAKEYAIDINHSNGIYITDVIIGNGLPSKSQLITIKGGSRDIHITGKFKSKTTKNFYIDIGNWSDQSYDYSENITLELYSPDGKPIGVRIGRGKNVTLLGNCVETKLESLKVKAYWYLKYFVRKLLKIKVNERGPSWL